MKNFFVGIDISKDWLDVSVYEKESYKNVYTNQVKNDVNSITKLSKALKRKFGYQNLWFCFEHTGNYGILLRCVLEDQELPYSAVSALEIKRSLGITRGKNDAIDAARIAEYAIMKAHKLKPSALASKELIQVKQLLTYRGQLVKIRTQLKNSLKAHKVLPEKLRTCYVIKDINQRLVELGESIKEVEQQVEYIIKSVPEIKENYKYARSVKGIGLNLAAQLLVITQNFEAFDNARKLNCYMGLAPFEHSSGKYQGTTKTSKLRDKKLKALIFNGANTASMHDPQLKNYYKRKIAEGKNEKSVLNAIACKMIYRVFASVKRKSPYVVLAH